MTDNILFLYPALTIGFLFSAVPLLVHLINMLRHRRQRWAAMDFLLHSYRKQRKWIRLRQLLLLLSRLIVASLLVAMLCGWTGGGRALSVLGGTTTHHVVILDDSYSMGDQSVSRARGEAVGGSTAFGRALNSLRDLTRRLAGEDGNHQLTVLRSSRATMAVRNGSNTSDVAADLSFQTIAADGKLINRVMSSSVSPLRTDLSDAIDLASELVSVTPADTTYVYLASDFRDRDWGSSEKMSAAIRRLPSDVIVRMIDCANRPSANLGLVDVSPVQDVWVAGVPVVINVTVENYSQTAARNVVLQTRVISYDQTVQSIDPSRRLSGSPESLPALTIESIPPGGRVTKSFQVFVSKIGTHAIEVSLPEDALAIDNTRCCTLPLSDAEKVLVIDGDSKQRGAYHIASVLDPGSQVRIGAVPDIQPPSFLRSASWEDLAAYRAIYLIDVPEINGNAADALQEYVSRGGGLAWFLGSAILPKSYNQMLTREGRRLLPGQLTVATPLPASGDAESPELDLHFGQSSSALLGPLQSAGETMLGLVGLTRSWVLEVDGDPSASPDASGRMRVERILDRRDGLPLVLAHELGRGRVITVLSGLDGSWTNWPGDPTFVVFMLQTNAMLWSGSAPPTSRSIDQPLVRTMSTRDYSGAARYVPPVSQPPRVPIDVDVATAEDLAGNADRFRSRYRVEVNPNELLIAGDSNIDPWLRPGVAEWALPKVDGTVEVIPAATVIQIGEGDLSRTDHAAIRQSVLPVEAKFVASNAWSDENRVAGSSTLGLFLLCLLGTFLAVEQTLAFWASYHVRTGTGAAS